MHSDVRADRMSSRWDSGAALALRFAGLCVIGLEATWVMAALVPATHRGDAVALNGFTQLGRPRLDALANDLLHLLAPLSYTLFGVALIVVALLRGRPRVALAVAFVLALAPATSEALKPLLAHPHAQIGWSDVGQASWPSGHSTAAMALVLSALLVAPRKLRPTVAALGSLFAVAVGFSLLVLAWHLPSDVFGGYLVAALWVALAVAALRSCERRWPSRKALPGRRAISAGPGSLPQGEDMLIPVLVAVAVMAGTIVVLLLRTHQVETFAIDHRSLVVAAVGIASLAVLISTTLTSALRR